MGDEFCPYCDSEVCTCGYLAEKARTDETALKEMAREFTSAPAPQADDLVDQLRKLTSPDDIAGQLARYEPPTDSMQRAVMREKLLAVLVGKLKAPAKVVDAWLGQKAEDPTGAQLDREQAVILVKLVRERAVLFHTADGDAYATVEFNGHRENHRIRGRRFKQWMLKMFFDNAQAEERTGEGLGGLLKALAGDKIVPGAQAIRDALATLEALANFEGQEFEVAIRVAGFGDRVFLDLGDEEWRAVEMRPGAWEVVADPPVKFIRPEGLRPLPVPTRGGSLKALRRWVNVEDKEWPLVLGFSLGMLRARGPYWVLNLLGEQGAAKSAAAKYIRLIVDPYVPIHRARPRNEHDLVIHASRSWVVSFDNLSEVQEWFSDGLCRLATGGGFGARKLYSDDEERLFDAQRPCILNGIEELAVRGDLLDRSILVTLPKLEDDAFRKDDDLDKEFEAEHAKILGALLDAAVVALERFDKIELDKKVRMVAAASWTVAGEEALGLEEGAFMKAYLENRAESNALTLEASKVAAEVAALMADRPDWSGTATALLNALDHQASDETKRSKQWPQCGRKLAGDLRRLAPAFRRVGLHLEFTREGHGHTRSISITRKANNRPHGPQGPQGQDRWEL